MWKLSSSVIGHVFRENASFFTSSDGFATKGGYHYICKWVNGTRLGSLGASWMNEWRFCPPYVLKQTFIWLALTSNWDLKCEWISLEIIFSCKGCCYLSELLLSFEILCYLGKFFRKWNIPIVGIFPYRIFSVINLTYYMLIFLNVHI